MLNWRAPLWLKLWTVSVWMFIAMVIVGFAFPPIGAAWAIGYAVWALVQRRRLARQRTMEQALRAVAVEKARRDADIARGREIQRLL